MGQILFEAIAVVKLFAETVTTTMKVMDNVVTYAVPAHEKILIFDHRPCVVQLAINREPIIDYGHILTAVGQPAKVVVVSPDRGKEDPQLHLYDSRGLTANALLLENLLDQSPPHETKLIFDDSLWSWQPNGNQQKQTSSHQMLSITDENHLLILKHSGNASSMSTCIEMIGRHVAFMGLEEYKLVAAIENF